jgi:hypothetical protein
VLVVIGVWAIYASRADYRAFDAKRRDWHLRCDAYVDKPVTSPAARDCARELEELIAYAKQKGWQ